jgi:hypothetical protein
LQCSTVTSFAFKRCRKSILSPQHVIMPATWQGSWKDLKMITRSLDSKWWGYIDLGHTTFWRNKDCCAEIATWLNIIISYSSKSIWVIKLSFCQNGPVLWEYFWQKDSLITHILRLIMIFTPIANFAQRPLVDYFSYNVSVSFCMH